MLLLVPPRPKPGGGGVAPIPFGLDDEELLEPSDGLDTVERIAARVPLPAPPPPLGPRGGPIGLLRFGGGGAILLVSADDAAGLFF